MADSDSTYPVSVHLLHALGRQHAIEACEILKGAYPINAGAGEMIGLIDQALQHLREAQESILKARSMARDIDLNRTRENQDRQTERWLSIVGHDMDGYGEGRPFDEDPPAGEA